MIKAKKSLGQNFLIDQNIIDIFIKKIDLHIADGGTVVITSHNQKDKFTNVEL